MALLLDTTYGDIVVDLFTDKAPNAISALLLALTQHPLTSQSLLRVEKDFSLAFGFKENFSLRLDTPDIRPSRFEAFGTVGIDAAGLVFTLRDRVESFDRKFRAIGRVADGTEATLRRIAKEVVVDSSGKPLVEKTAPRIRGVFVLEDSTGKLGGIDEFNGKTVEAVVAREVGRVREEAERRRAKEKRREEQEKVLFVCRLNKTTEEGDLKVIFSRFGEVRRVNVIRDSETKESLGYGFIEFTEKAACDKAHACMQSAEIDGRKIRVDFAQGQKHF